MSKFAWRNGFAAGLIAGVCFSAFLYVLLSFASDPQGDPINTERKCEESSEECSKEENHSPYKFTVLRRLVQLEDTVAQWLMTFFALAAVGVSTLAVVWVKRTYDATQAGAAIAREIGQAQARAYVSVESVYVIPDIEPETIGWTVEINLFNTGQSPATNVEASASIVGPQPFKIRGIGRSIPSGKDSNVGLIFRKPLANFPKDPSASGERQMVFIIEPRITFRDIFMGDSERTTICFAAIGTFEPKHWHRERLDVIETNLFYQSQEGEHG